MTIIEPGAFRTGFHERPMEVAAGVEDPDSPYAPLYQSLATGFFGGPEPPTGEIVAEEEAFIRDLAGRFGWHAWRSS